MRSIRWIHRPAELDGNRLIQENTDCIRFGTTMVPESTGPLRFGTIMDDYRGVFATIEGRGRALPASNWSISNLGFQVGQTPGFLQTFRDIDGLSPIAVFSFRNIPPHPIRYDHARLL
jgi:hypothetical protein